MVCFKIKAVLRTHKTIPCYKNWPDLGCKSNLQYSFFYCVISCDIDKGRLRAVGSWWTWNF